MTHGVVNLALWQKYVEQVCGFVLPEVQHNWLVHAITMTAQAYDLSVDELYDGVLGEYERYLPTECLPKLTQSLLDNLLIAESHFFRHEPSMAFIGEKYKSIIHAHNKAMREGKKLGGSPNFSVWSVGCSTGQEVYSVAMTLDLIFKQVVNPLPFIVYGSDLSAHSLNMAKKGEYFGRQVQEIPARYRTQIKPMSDDVAAGVFNHQKTWKIDPKIKEHTQFFWHNVFTKKNTGLSKHQIIICQNVLIYFRKFDQRDILAYFVRSLAVGGYLLFAPNEAMFWQHPNMRRVDDGQVNAWQKISE